MSAPQLSVLIALHDEVAATPDLYLQVVAACEALGRSFEIVYVDDGSHDGSGQLLDNLVDEDPRVRVIHLRRNFGRSAALAAGFVRVRGEVVVTLDADLQDDPAMLADFVARIDAGADIVAGWKQRQNHPTFRSARVRSAMILRLAGLELHDLDCGLRAYRTSCLRALHDVHGGSQSGARLLPVLAHVHGFRVEELVVHPRERRGEVRRRGGGGLRRSLDGLVDVLHTLLLTRHRGQPARLLALPGILLGALGLVLLLLFGALLAYNALTSMLAAIGLVLVIFGGQLLAAGLLGELLGGPTRPAAQFYAIRDERGASDEVRAQFELEHDEEDPRTTLAPARAAPRPATLASTPRTLVPQAAPAAAPSRTLVAPQQSPATTPTRTLIAPARPQLTPSGTLIDTQQATPGRAFAPAATVATGAPEHLDYDEDGPTTIAIDREQNPLFRPNQ